MGRGKLYVTLQCHFQDDFCIEMGSDESHFNVSLIVRRDEVSRWCPQTTPLEDRGELKRNLHYDDNFAPSFNVRVFVCCC